MEQVLGKNRLHTRCAKWDGLEELFGERDLLAMWVADMDFECPQSVKNVLQERTAHNVYGYGIVPESYYQAFINWEREVHGYRVEKEWIEVLPGVVVGFFWAINIFTKPEDACMILTPLYGPFQDSIRTTGRTLVESKLIEENGVYRMDMDDIEAKMKAHEVKIFFLCSPHNPVGRVWRREELSGITELCRKYDVLLISDEIHQDIIPGEHPQIPTATVSDYRKRITLTAPSKTFNLAGCQNAFAIIEDEAMRMQWQQYRRTIGINDGNIFGYLAAEAAYNGGRDWLDSLNAVIRENFVYFRDALLQNAPKLVISPLEGTYLAWVDFGAYVPHAELETFFCEKCRLAVNVGDRFALLPGDTHVRINLATPIEQVEEAVRRIITALADK